MVVTPGATEQRVVVIDDYDGFSPLRESWNSLCATGSVFLRHEWFDAAWQWRKLEEGTRLSILCVYRGSDLRAALPLVATRPQGRQVSRSVLEYLAVPDTQHCGLIVTAPDLDWVVEALAGHLGERRHTWDRLRVPHVSADDPDWDALRRALSKRGIRGHCTATGGNPFIDLRAGWDEYYGTRSRSLKKANNLAANRLAKLGRISIGWLDSAKAPATEVAAGIEAAISISARSWKRTTGNSLDQPGPQGFIRRLSELASAQGWLSLWLLSLDDRPLAMEYQLIYGGRVHALRSDFVDDTGETSPGSHLNRSMLEQLFGRGFGCYLMGPGDNPYKKRWTDVAEPLFNFDAYSPTIRGRVADFWEWTAKPALRAARTRIRTSRGTQDS